MRIVSSACPSFKEADGESIAGGVPKTIKQINTMFFSILGRFCQQPGHSHDRPPRFGGQNVDIVYILSLARALLQAQLFKPISKLPRGQPKNLRCPGLVSACLCQRSAECFWRV